MNEKNRREYHSRNVTDFHSCISGPLALYACFGVCDDPNENIFSSYECIMKPTKAQIYLIAISAGYVTYDLAICIWELGYTMKKGGDFILHHIVGWLGAVAVLVSGRFNVALSCGQLVSELTGFFMNHRWRMIKHGQGEGLFFMVINALFFFSYIFARIVFMAMLLLRNYQVQTKFDIFSDPQIITVCAIVSSLMQVALYCIQLVWFKLIFGAFLMAIKGEKPRIQNRDN